MKPVLRLVVACLLLVASWMGPGVARAAVLNPDDAMLFDVRAGALRLGDGVRGYQMGEKTCVNFADVAAALDVAVRVDVVRGVAQGWVFSESSLLHIDRASGRVRSNGHESAIPERAIVDADGGWCVDHVALARWLGVGIEVDALNALLIVTSDTPLPAQAAAERRARAEVLDFVADKSDTDVRANPVKNLDVPYRAWRMPSVDVTAGLSMTRGIFGGDYEVFAAGEMAWMSAEGRLGSDARGKLSSMRLRMYRADPDAGLLGRVRASEVALGDVSSQATRMGARSASGRGATITNRPLGTPGRFDTLTLTGDVPMGWDVELYRNGELTGIDDAGTTGRYAFRDVPLVYGNNRIEIVRHGPQGQTRRERHVYEVGQSAVPPGDLWWWAGAVEDGRDLIGFLGRKQRAGAWRGGLGLEYGLDLRTSVALSFQAYARNGRARHLFEGEARRDLGMMTLAVTGAHDRSGGKAGAFTALGRVMGLRFSVNGLLNRGLDSEQVSGSARGRGGVTIERDLTLGGLVMPVHFDLDQIRNLDGSRTRTVGARVSGSTRALSVTLAGGFTRQAQPHGGFGPRDGRIGMLVSGKVGAVTVRGEMNHRIGGQGGLCDARISGEGTLSSRDSWQSGAGYSWETRRWSAHAGYSHRFDPLTLSASASGETSGAVSARLSVMFSLGRDAHGRFGRISSQRMGSSGAVAVRIYRDENGDGLRGDDEPLATGARVRIAGQPAGAEQGADAAVMIAGLVPVMPVSVAIDPASLGDPLLDPVVRAVRVVPRKGMTLAIDLGVAATGVVEGHLVHPDGSEAANVPVSLIGPDGAVVATTRSDFDGSFLFEKVRYGIYRLVVDRDEIRASISKGGEHIVVERANPTRRLGAVLLPGGTDGPGRVAMGGGE